MTFYDLKQRLFKRLESWGTQVEYIHAFKFTCECMCVCVHVCTYMRLPVVSYVHMCVPFDYLKEVACVYCHPQNDSGSVSGFSTVVQ